MEDAQIDVKEASLQDIRLIADYWEKASDTFLESLGVDLSKRVSGDVLIDRLTHQHSLSYADKQAYPLIWFLNSRPIGHCNINMISYGEVAHMHLHLWEPLLRRSGYGARLVRMSLPFFFENFKLQKIICEPYALNDAPNKTLEKVGFTFVKEYITVPGAINFEQPVKQWEITIDDFKSL
jgi:RimJ/RimL family protein N-acetyltransferase